MKNSSSEKFSNVKSKYSSKPSVNATYDPRVPGSKAPPPPPPPPPRQADQEELEGYDNDAETYDEETPLPTGPPPVIPRHSKPVASSNPILSLNGHQLPSSLNQVRWSQISHNEKEQLFGWLDEFFGVNHASAFVSKASIRCFFAVVAVSFLTCLSRVLCLQ